MTLYEILEISPNASSEVIKSAYKALVKKFHPDQYPQAKKLYAEEKMKEINNAYEILGDEEKREYYNILLGIYSIPRSSSNDSSQTSTNSDFTTSDNNVSSPNSHTESGNSSGIFEDMIELGRSKKRMLYGILWALGGAILTAITYGNASSTGGTYFIFYGAIFWGIIDFLRGVFVWVKCNNRINKYSAKDYSNSNIVNNTNEGVKDSPQNIAKDYTEGDYSKKRSDKYIFIIAVIMVIIVGVTIFSFSQKNQNVSTSNNSAIINQSTSSDSQMGDNVVNSTTNETKDITEYMPANIERDNFVSQGSNDAIETQKTRDESETQQIAKPKESLLKYFSLGSPANEVKRIMGTPDSIAEYPALNQTTWEYGNSEVTFDNNGIVTEWRDRDDKLKVFMKAKTPGATFTKGSTKDEVLDAMGTPDSIAEYPALNQTTWEYGNSEVTFDNNGIVTEWRDRDDKLKVFMKAKTSGATFTKGSTKDEVLDAMGTPDSIAEYPALNQTTWEYGNSEVTFDNNGIVTGWRNTDNNLQIR